MNVVVEKWGHSAAIRVPVGLLAAARMAVDDTVDIHAEPGRLVMELVHPPEPVGVLIGRITPGNLYGEVDFGRAAGREVW